MNIVEMSINDIKAYPNNPRKNDMAVDAVAESIRQFGFKVPLVIDKNNEIVTGHTRYKACQKLGIEKIPCIVADDLNEEQIKAFRLVDNKTSEISDWDYALLDLELDGIDDIDMSAFGFEDFGGDLNINDSDFIQDTEITKSRTKEITCPECGHVFEV